MIDAIKDVVSILLTALVGYIGVAVKKAYTKYVNDETKKEVVDTCVQAVEQLYKDLHGDEKLQKAIEYASEMLCSKGISVGEVELRMLVEAAVAKFNDVFKQESSTTKENNNCAEA